jgi:hypothetical protein
MRTRRHNIPINDLQAQAEFSASIGDVFSLHLDTALDGAKVEQRRAQSEADRARAEFMQSHFQLCHIRD